MSKYIYKCRECRKEFKSEYIESEFVYLCPECGSCNRKEPIRGVLEIVYDYESLRKIDINEFLDLKPGQIWRYPYLWPSEFNFPEEILSRLEVPDIPIITSTHRGMNIFLMDESRNPSLSYKDRASILTALKAMELGVSDISAASTGNAGSSLACICSRMNLKSHIFVPSSIPEAKLLQIKAYGANIHISDSDYDTAYDECLRVSKKNKWYIRNTAYNPLTIEGKKSAVYDLFIRLKGELPDAIIIPVGDGVIMGGFYKGLRELKKLGWINKMPKLIGVQAEGSDALIRHLKTGLFEYIPAYTIADSISAAAPRNLYMAAEAIKETNGIGVSVGDGAILAAQKLIAQSWGILCEPSCSATLAALDKILSDSLVDSDNFLLLLTGNGLKDLNSLRAADGIKL